MPRGGDVVHGAAALSTCASTESLEAIGRLTKRIATFVDGHATGHRPPWVQTNAGRSRSDSHCVSDAACTTFESVLWRSARRDVQAKRGCRPRAVPRAGMCARVTVCTTNSGGAALVVEFGALRRTRACVSHVTTWPLVSSRL